MRQPMRQAPVTGFTVGGSCLPKKRIGFRMPTLTKAKSTPLEKAETALALAEAHLRQAREEMDDDYLERLAILEANVQAVIDGVKRVTGAKDG